MLYQTETSLHGNDTLSVPPAGKRPTRGLKVADLAILLFAFLAVVMAFVLLAVGSVVAWAVQAGLQRLTGRRSVPRLVLSEDRLETSLSAAGFALGTGGLVWIMLLIRSDMIGRLWA